MKKQIWLFGILLTSVVYWVTIVSINTRAYPAALRPTSPTPKVAMRDVTPALNMSMTAVAADEPECVFDPPDTTNATNAPCYADLTAVAYSSTGESAASAPVRVHFVPAPTPTPTPADTLAPTAVLTSHASGAALSGNVTVTATATDNVGVAVVYLIVDDSVVITGTLAGTTAATGDPYNFTLDTKQLADGEHFMYARAWDASANAGDSQRVTFTVSNFTPTPTPTPTATPTPAPSPSASPTPCTRALPNGKTKRC